MVPEISPNPLAMPDRSTVDGDRLGVDSKGHDTAKESEFYLQFVNLNILAQTKLLLMNQNL